MSPLIRNFNSPTKIIDDKTNRSVRLSNIKKIIESESKRICEKDEHQGMDTLSRENEVPTESPML